MIITSYPTYYPLHPGTEYDNYPPQDSTSNCTIIHYEVHVYAPLYIMIVHVGDGYKVWCCDP
jgi:hypothetical protein